MPHIINTNTGYCETHQQFEYVVLQAGGTGASNSSKPNNKVQSSQSPNLKDMTIIKEKQTPPLPNPDQFQVKIFEDKENAIYKHSSKSKLKSQPRRILVEKEMVSFYYFYQLIF